MSSEARRFFAFPEVKSLVKKFCAGEFEENLVRMAGLEPARVTPLPPQSSASANFATCARNGDNEPAFPGSRKVNLARAPPDWSGGSRFHLGGFSGVDGWPAGGALSEGARCFGGAGKGAFWVTARIQRFVLSVSNK